MLKAGRNEPCSYRSQKNKRTAAPPSRNALSVGQPRRLPASGALALQQLCLTQRFDMIMDEACAALINLVRRNLELVAVRIAEINRLRDLVILEVEFDSALL